MKLADEYQKRLKEVLEPLAQKLNNHIHDCFKGEPRIDRISSRAKSQERFLAKAAAKTEGRAKYSEPLRQIQDQIGSRIIVFYLTDVERICGLVEKYFRQIEAKNMVPESEWQFGYFGRHYVLLIPSDVVGSSFDKTTTPEFFELQIKTLFQHAWSEANHDVGYKPELGPLISDETRKLAFTSAEAWGADLIFDQLFRDVQNRLAAHP